MPCEYFSQWLAFMLFYKNDEPTYHKVKYLKCTFIRTRIKDNHYLGWLKHYEFSNTDFSTILKLSEEMWNTSNVQLLWKFLIGLCAEAVYGGRIDNIEDLHVLYSYLEQYFNDNILSVRYRPFQINASLPTNSKYEVYKTINFD